MPAVRRLQLTILASAWLLGLQRVGGAAAVYLRPSASIPSAECSLGELAVVAADGPVEQQRLAAVKLGRALRGPSLVSPAELRRRIAEEYGGGIDLIGGRVAVIPQGSVPAGQEWFYFELLGALDRLDGGSASLELELLSRPEVPSEPTGVEFELGGSKAPSGRLAGRVQLVFRSAGKQGSAEGGLLLWIHSYLYVARAARDLARGRVLEPNDVEYVQTDVSRLSARFLAAPDLAGLWRTIAPIARGELLDSARLRRDYWVNSGDAVLVVFQRPGLRVSLPGKAFGSGGQGEAVEVRLPGSTRRFRARITGVREGVVEVL